MITKIIHTTFMTPLMSCRRKMSTMTLNKSMNQAIQMKKMSIVHRTSRNG